MNIRRALSVTKRIFRGLRNDRRTVGLMFIAPIIAMCVFGLAFSGDVKDVHVVVVNHDEGYQIPPAPDPISIADRTLPKIYMLKFRTPLCRSAPRSR